MPYRKVDTKVWNDEKVMGLNPTEKLIWLFLLTSPFTTNLPGLFVATEEALASFLGIPLEGPPKGFRSPSGSPSEGFREGFRELCRKGFLKADFARRVVFLPHAVRYNRPESPNAAKGFANRLADIPDCALKEESIRVFDEDSKHWRPSFRKAWEVASEGLRKGFRKGSRQEQEQEREQEQEGPPAAASLAVGQDSSADVFVARGDRPMGPDASVDGKQPPPTEAWTAAEEAPHLPTAPTGPTTVIGELFSSRETRRDPAPSADSEGPDAALRRIPPRPLAGHRRTAFAQLAARNASLDDDDAPGGS